MSARRPAGARLLAGSGPIRTLVDLSVAPPGGAGTYVRGFAEGLARADVADLQALVVLFDRSWATANRSVVDAVLERGIVVDELDLDRPGSWGARLRRGRVLQRAITRHGVDVAFFPREVASRVRVPYVLLARNMHCWRSFGATGTRAKASRWLLRRAAHWSCRGAASVLAVSEPMAEALSADIAVAGIVHHGCSTPSYDRDTQADGRRPRVVAMVANIMPNKGIELLVDGVATAREAAQAWELKVYGGIGDEVYASFVRRQAEARLGSSVFQGPAYGDDLVTAYRDAHVLAVGGTFESFCQPLVEGMRSGCVIVAPACDLVSEICGEVAVTYRDGDSGSLAEALELAWEQRGVRSRAGLERARSFTWERTVVETITLVRSAADPGAGNA